MRAQLFETSGTDYPATQAISWENALNNTAVKHEKLAVQIRPDVDSETIVNTIVQWMR
jgi:hypothetical protein